MPRRPSKNPAERVSFSLPQTHREKLAQLIVKLGENKSQIVQRAIDCLFEDVQTWPKE